MNFETDVEEDFEGATKLCPSDFARKQGIAPQMVHYYVRTGILEKEWCVCGRYVIDVAEGEASLSTHQQKRGRNVDTRGD